MNRWDVNFKEDKQLWDAFVSTSPQRSIFVYTKFLDSLLANYDLVTCYEKGKIVAGAVLIYSEAGEPIDRPYPFTQYQGVLLADSSSQSAHSQITHEFKVVEYFISQLTEHYKKCCFCHSWRLNDLRPFLWHNYHAPEQGRFKVELRYTGVLDLKKYHDFDAYLTSVRACRKQEFKKSSQLLKREFSEDSAILDSLHAKTFARQNLTRSYQDSALLKSICRHAVEGGYGKMSFVRLDEIPVAAVLFLYDDRTAYYLFGANDPAYRNSNAGSFLLLQMIKDAFEDELKEIDFVGVNSPSRGDYKISLNAELKDYHLTTLNGSI